MTHAPLFAFSRRHPVAWRFPFVSRIGRFHSRSAAHPFPFGVAAWFPKCLNRIMFFVAGRAWRANFPVFFPFNGKNWPVRLPVSGADRGRFPMALPAPRRGVDPLRERRRGKGGGAAARPARRRKASCAGAGCGRGRGPGPRSPPAAAPGRRRLRSRRAAGAPAPARRPGSRPRLRLHLVATQHKKTCYFIFAPCVWICR